MATFPTPQDAIHAAIRMQNAINEDTKLSQFNVSIKIGFHSGWVLEKKGDVYGDNVNVAARIASLANSSQIFTTRTSLEQLTTFLGISSRSHGFVNIKGKQDKIEIVEVIWQDDTSEITSFTHMAKPLHVRAPLNILLFYGGKLHRIGNKHCSITLGRDKTNDIVVNEQMVSRNHATIEPRHNRCIITDKSSNGTFIRVDESGEELHIHRDEIQLTGSGVISMGCEINTKDPRIVYYKCDQAKCTER